MKFIIFLLLATTTIFASTKNNWVPKYKKIEIKKALNSDSKNEKLKSSAITDLEKMYMKEAKGKAHLSNLKRETLELKQQAVPILLKVMRSKSFPNESRWIATYMLGRIMGVKAAPLISKYASHPNWMLRLASLKVLLHLDQKQYKGIYARLLEDNSLIVRHQALQNIKQMNLKDLGPYVWKMLYNKKNYVGLRGERKRAHIIRDAIKTVGDLGFNKAKSPMLKMLQNTKYKDVYSELDYSLSKIVGKNSPDGPISIKKRFWARL